MHYALRQPVFSTSLRANCVQLTIYEEIQCIWVNNFSAFIHKISPCFVYMQRSYSRALSKTQPHTHTHTPRSTFTFLICFILFMAGSLSNLSCFFLHTKAMTTHMQTHNRSFSRLVHKSAMKHKALWVFWRNKVSELFFSHRFCCVSFLSSLSVVKLLSGKRTLIICFYTAKTNVLN